MTNFIVIDYNVKQNRDFDFERANNVESITAFINRDIFDIEKHNFKDSESELSIIIVDIDIISAISLHIFVCSGIDNNILVIVEDIEKYKNIKKYLEDYTHINITLCDNKNCFERWLEKGDSSDSD